jgi:hypothetical protein
MDRTEDAPSRDLAPDPETLALLRDLCQRFGMVRASGISARSVSERHALEHGHALRFGCCRVTPPAA